MLSVRIIRAKTFERDIFMKKFKLFSYEPPAKGVKKNDDRASVQTDFFGFFIMYGRKFWNLSNLNLLMAVYILIVSFGVWQVSAYPIAFYAFLALAALAFGIVNTGAVYAVRGYVRGDPVYILSDFRYAVKHNWKQGILMGLLDLAVIVLLVFDLFFWSGMDVTRLPVLPETDSDTQITETVPGDAQSATVDADKENTALSAAADVKDTENTGKSDSFDPSVTVTPTAKPRSFMEKVFFYACVFLIFIYGFMRNYMYLIMVTFKLSIFKILKNSFIFAFLGIKRNLAALAGILLVCFINVYIFVYLPFVGLTLPLIITTSTVFFIGAYAAYPVIKKYMISPYYKDEDVYEEYDRIFKDRG